MKFFLILFLSFVCDASSRVQIERHEILEEERSITEFSVKKWGAVGDGQTDDYESIQKAIEEQLPLGKVILYFPPGKFKVSHTLKVLVPKGYSLSTFKFLIQGAGVHKTEVFVSDKDKNTLEIESAHNKVLAQGILSNLTLGPERQSEDLGWPLHLKRVEDSSFTHFSTKGPKCNVRTLHDSGNSFRMTADKNHKTARPSCIAFQ